MNGGLRTFVKNNLNTVISLIKSNKEYKISNNIFPPLCSLCKELQKSVIRRHFYTAKVSLRFTKENKRVPSYHE